MKQASRVSFFVASANPDLLVDLVRSLKLNDPSLHCVVFACTKQSNIQFRKLVAEKRRAYLSACFKSEKRALAKSIVDDIKAMDPPGRFLSKDYRTGLWFPINEDRAREKASQALRENAKSIRENMEKENCNCPTTTTRASSGYPTYPARNQAVLMDESNRHSYRPRDGIWSKQPCYYGGHEQHLQAVPQPVNPPPPPYPNYPAPPTHATYIHNLHNFPAPPTHSLGTTYIHNQHNFAPGTNMEEHWHGSRGEPLKAPLQPLASSWGGPSYVANDSDKKEVAPRQLYQSTPSCTPKESKRQKVSPPSYSEGDRNVAPILSGQEHKDYTMYKPCPPRPFLSSIQTQNNHVHPKDHQYPHNEHIRPRTSGCHRSRLDPLQTPSPTTAYKTVGNGAATPAAFIDAIYASCTGETPPPPPNSHRDYSPFSYSADTQPAWSLTPTTYSAAAAAEACHRKTPARQLPPHPNTKDEATGREFCSSPRAL